jgi:hypothetical protein
MKGDGVHLQEDTENWNQITRELEKDSGKLKLLEDLINKQMKNCSKIQRKESRKT